MFCVYNLRQLPAIDELLIHVHFDVRLEFLLPFHHIFAQNFGNCRPPSKKETKIPKINEIVNFQEEIQNTLIVDKNYV